MADLDINHLIAESHGGLTAEKVSDAEVVGRLRQLESRGAPQFARGVDLAAVRDKHFRQHRWTMIATFDVSDETMTAMFQERHEIAGYVARNEVVPERNVINIPMGGDNVVETQGPGCAKCNVLWEHPENGYGTMCQVDDRQFEQAKAEQRAQMEMQRRAEMDRIVALEKAKL